MSQLDPERAKFERKTLNAYATLICSVNELKKLRGLDSGEKLDPRDKIRATAARVGLGIPKVGRRLLLSIRPPSHAFAVLVC